MDYIRAGNLGFEGKSPRIINSTASRWLNNASKKLLGRKADHTFKRNVYSDQAFYMRKRNRFLENKSMSKIAWISKALSHAPIRQEGVVPSYPKPQELQSPG
jgi:hypothetical protein